MKGVYCLICVAVCLTVTGCSPKRSNDGEASSSSSSSDSSSSSFAQNDAPAPPPPPQVQAPSHNYASVDGELYLYAQGLSDDQIRAGQAAGGFVGLKYLGELNGVYMLQQENSDQIDTCTNPCTFIKVTNQDGALVDRIQWVPSSIIAEAFSDAFNGFLKPSVNVPGYTGGGGQ